MCINCGCGEYDKKHKPTDMTLDDLKKMADGQNMDVQQTADNIQQTAKSSMSDKPS